MTPDILIYLISDDGFARDGLQSLMLEAGFFVLCRPPEPLELDIDDAHWRQRVALVVGDWEPALANALALRRDWPSLAIALLSDPVDASGLGVVLNANINGLFERALSRSALIKLVSLVAEGESVFSAIFARALVEPQQDYAVKTFDDAVLSVRDREVLRYLTEGHSNKYIANKLEIAESTVKVRVAAILRKLKLRNRTHAGIWASSVLGPTVETPNVRSIVDRPTFKSSPQGVLGFINRGDGQAGPVRQSSRKKPPERV